MCQGHSVKVVWGYESSGPKTGAWNDWKKHMNHMKMPYKCPYGVFFGGKFFLQEHTVSDQIKFDRHSKR